MKLSMNMVVAYLGWLAFVAPETAFGRDNEGCEHDDADRETYYRPPTPILSVRFNLKDDGSCCREHQYPHQRRSHDTKVLVRGACRNLDATGHNKTRDYTGYETQKAVVVEPTRLHPGAGGTCRAEPDSGTRSIVAIIAHSPVFQPQEPARI